MLSPFEEACLYYRTPIWTWTWGWWTWTWPPTAIKRGSGLGLGLCCHRPWYQSVSHKHWFQLNAECLFRLVLDFHLYLRIPATSCCWLNAFSSATSFCSWDIAVCICDTALTNWLSTCSVRPQLLKSLSCWMTSYVDCDDVRWRSVTTHRHSCSNAILTQFSCRKKKQYFAVMKLAPYLSVAID